MAKVQNGEEILPKVSSLSRVHERYREIDSLQTVLRWQRHERNVDDDDEIVYFTRALKD